MSTEKYSFDKYSHTPKSCYDLLIYSNTVALFKISTKLNILTMYSKKAPFMCKLSFYFYFTKQYNSDTDINILELLSLIRIL